MRGTHADLAPPCALPPAPQVVELDEEGTVWSQQEVPTSLLHKGDVMKVGACACAGG